MIDTHCHLLPGLDDGPETLDDAVGLARHLVAQGVEAVVCTPHWSSTFPTRHDEAVGAREALQAELRRQDVQIELVVSAELSEVVAATRPSEEIRSRSLAGHWVIVELVANALPLHVETITTRLEAQELGIILAHPERCRAVQDDPGALDGARAAGALVQVVAPSLTGRTGRRVRKAAWSLLQTGRVDLVASDAHDVDKRRCELEEAGRLVFKELGSEHWEELTRRIPRVVLQGGDPYG